MKPLRIFLFILLFGGFSAGFTLAQFQTDSNTVQTSIGNPQSSPIAASCPIAGGTITCGSKFTSANNCGHCGLNYGQNNINAYCNYQGIEYAADISIPGANVQNREVLLPQIYGKSVIWNLYDVSDSSVGSIIKYKGLVDNETYIIQFHHTQSGSQKQRGGSGDVGARICTGSSCDHVHIEFYKLTPRGDKQYIDAAQTFCK